MGLSHALQLNGLLDDVVEFVVVDKSLTSRCIAKLLLKNVKVFADLRKVPSLCFFDFAVLATPPINRREHLAEISSRSKYCLIEKPVLGPLPANAMSGYVYQHLPIFDYFSERFLELPKSVDVEILTNLDFTSTESWRARSGIDQLSSEFLGHALTFGLTPLSVNNELLALTLNNFSSRDPNEIDISFNSGSLMGKIRLRGAQSVRKTTIKAKFQFDEASVTMTPYDLRSSDGWSVNIASRPICVGFYLRGFEFCRQASSFISGKGDKLTRDTLNKIDNIVMDVSGHG